MNKLLLAFLPALLITATAAVPALRAQESMPQLQVSMKVSLTPFNLAYLAHMGYFESQGLPGYNLLMSEYRSGRVTAAKIVQKAVDAKALPASFLKNQAYIDSLDTQLYSLSLNK
jgi:hypothetical protein